MHPEQHPVPWVSSAPSRGTSASTFDVPLLENAVLSRFFFIASSTVVVLAGRMERWTIVSEEDEGDGREVGNERSRHHVHMNHPTPNSLAKTYTHE